MTWKISFRNLLKHRMISLINILGLAIGLAAALLIIMHVSHETSYDSCWERSDQMYRISYDRYQNGELSFTSAKSLKGMAAVLRDKIPEVLSATEIQKDVVSVYTENSQIQDIRMFISDSTFFDVFDLDFIRKKGADPLTGLYSSVISESAAKSLFGTEDAVGKWFKVSQGWRFCVTGVFRDLPTNTHFPFDMLLSWHTYTHYFQNFDNDSGTEVIRNPDAWRNNRPVTSWSWGYNGCYTYLVVQKGADPREVESKIAAIAPDYIQSILQNDGKADFHLQPVTGIHLESNLENEIQPNGERSHVVILILISLVILCIAWINFINLTLIRAVEHARWIGLRKIAGAGKIHLIGQFLGEAMLINLIAIVLAILLVFLSKGWFASFCGMPVIHHIQGKYLIVFAAIICTGVLISGLYPAFYLSRYKPVDLFKGVRLSGTGRVDFRKILVVAQFAASILLISGVLTVYKQISYMKNIDLGIQIEQTLVTWSPSTMIGRPQRMSKLESFRNSVRTISGVESFTTSSAVPGKEILWKRQDIRKMADLPNKLKSYAYTFIDYDFVPSFNLKLMAGRNFTPEENENSKVLIINEEAMKQLGFTRAETAIDSFVMVGRNQFQIIGVLKNYHQESLKKEIKPIVYFFGYRWQYDMGLYSIRVRAAHMDQTVAEIKNIWNQTYPEDQFKYFFLDDDFNAQYRSEQVFGRIFSLFTGLAIFIAVIGLWGLATYSSSLRAREIGIRKVNGAQNIEILLMLNRVFVKWVLLAFVVATPVSWFLMKQWLTNFAYKTSLSWWIFAFAGVIALGIALLTVSWQSWKSASRNPVEVLRNE